MSTQSRRQRRKAWRAHRLQQRREARRLATEPVVLEPLERRLLFSAAVISGVSPLENTHTAPVTTDITATYDQNIDAGGSVTDTTFVVHAMQTGQIVNPLHGNAISVVGDTITFNPDNDFKPGETIQVIATDGIQNTLAEPSQQRVWEFRTAATGGSGLFNDSGQSLGDHRGESVSLGDVDGDGDLDAFVANNGGNRVWRNDGSGNFTDSGQDLGNQVSSLASLDDVDGDGDLDAFVANNNGNRVWLNDGSGNFTDSGQNLGSQISRGVSLGDLDGDGDLDAFVADFAAGNRVWLGDGSGNFTDSGQSLGDHYSNGASLGDVDGDGDLDAFVANYGQGNRVWLNQDLDFGDAPAPFPTLRADDGARHRPTGPTLGTDRDGEIDGQPTAGADGDDNNGATPDDEDGVTIGTITAGELGATITVNVAGGPALLDAWIDFNGDGSWDLANEQIATGLVVNNGNNAVTFDVPANVVSGQQTFARFRISTTGGLGPRGLAADGEVEDHPLTIQADGGSGVFVDSGQSLGNHFSLGVTLGDVDGDGDLDALVASFGQGNRVWLGDGSGNFTDSGQSLGNHASGSVSLGDVDGDGDLDAFVANIVSAGNRVWSGDGSGNFTDSGQSLGNHNSFSVSLGDVDGDGDLDALIQP